MTDDRVACPLCGTLIHRPTIGFVICWRCGTRWDHDRWPPEKEDQR